MLESESLDYLFSLCQEKWSKLMSKVKPVLKISLKDSKTFHLQAANNSRFEVIGLGTFFKNVKKGEVEITADALKLLLKQKAREGIQAMEFWTNPFLIAWGSTSVDFQFSANCVNISNEAKKEVERLFVVV